jgi:hypothetical protein
MYYGFLNEIINRQLINNLRIKEWFSELSFAIWAACFCQDTELLSLIHYHSFVNLWRFSEWNLSF